jgi:hypothetical protein
MDNTIFKFLLGEVDIDGYWYGEQHPEYQGKFWWRIRLRQYFEQAQLQQHGVSNCADTKGGQPRD